MSQQKPSVNNTDNLMNSAQMFRAPLPPPSVLSASNLIKSIRASKFTSEPSPTSIATNGSKPPGRVSKFSDHPPGVVPPPVSTKVDAVAAAAAAAARINANLRAKGKLSDQTLLKPVVNVSPNSPLSLIQISETKKVFSSYIAKIDINDLPLSCRTYFTQVNVQETMNKETGAAISTKGQYLTTDEKKHLDGIEKQLHLFIQSPVKEKADLALSRLKDMISKQNISSSSATSALSINSLTPTPMKPLPPGQPSLPTGNFVQEKVFIGLDYCLPEFDLKSKLIGANYANFNFVANSTGSKVILRGRGSGFLEPTSGREAFESMYVFISHPNLSGVEAAKKLVYNLISTVSSEYNGYMSKKMGSTPPGSFPTTGNFPPYQSNQQMHINPYNNMSVPSGNPYIPNSYPAPPPPPGVNNPYSAQATGSVNQYMPPLVTNPYNTPAVTASNNMPPPNSNFATPAPSYDSPKHSSCEMNPPPNPPAPPESKQQKRRRFKEEQPDDSNLLGYKQYSSQDDSSNNKQKRPRKNDDITVNDVKSTEVLEDKSTNNLPFWMSHD